MLTKEKHVNGCKPLFFLFFRTIMKTHLEVSAEDKYLTIIPIFYKGREYKMYTEEQIKDHINDIQTLLVEQIPDYINSHKKDENFDALVEYSCNILLDSIQRSYYKYYKNTFCEDKSIKAFIEVSAFINPDVSPYYLAVAEFFKLNNNNVMKYLEKANELGFFCDDKVPLTDVEFSYCFVGPFKNGYDGFWEEVYKLILSMNTDKGIPELCKAVAAFYNAEDTEKTNKELDAAYVVNPEGTVIKELLAINCYNSSLWGNAVALFEQIQDTTTLLFLDDLYFMMGWCYGKLKESKNEIEAYKKSAEIFEEGDSTVNNLGYAYYKAKQYQSALSCFKKCLDNNWSVKYAANNYVRTLLAMHRFKDAKEFIKSAPTKIYKDLVNRVNAATNTNKRIKAEAPLLFSEEDDVPSVAEKDIRIGEKKEQFTSERILEDELFGRLDAGIPVFGKPLKIYRRKGIYGRQFVLSNGKRTDLLAEDEHGNLYVIELKKDSGYDDAYDQTVDYLEWFDKNWSEQVNNIYGIICLNNPSQKLILKARNNKRIKVYEYKISYTECL